MMSDPATLGISFLTQAFVGLWGKMRMCVVVHKRLTKLAASNLMPWHKLASLSQICLSTCATSILPLSTLVERMVVLLGCSFFVAGLLLAEPDRHRLAGATRRLSAECLCTVCGSCGPVVPCKLLVSQRVLISVCGDWFQRGNKTPV